MKKVQKEKRNKKKKTNPKLCKIDVRQFQPDFIQSTELLLCSRRGCRGRSFPLIIFFSRRQGATHKRALQSRYLHGLFCNVFLRITGAAFVFYGRGTKYDISGQTIVLNNVDAWRESYRKSGATRR